jgi:hypothetical protein
VSIMGNDTAEDLQSEYRVAFACYEVNKAVRILDEYFNRNYYADEYPDYVYSLALFMYKNGILTEDVKNRALECLEKKIGLNAYEESGEKMLKQRIKVLSEFQEMIISPLPPKKKIALNVNSTPIFNEGDMIALKLHTNRELKHNLSGVDEEIYKELHGKYFVIQKVSDNVSWTSAINPSVRDIWPRFLLYNYLGDNIPSTDDVQKLRPVYKTRNILFKSYTDPYVFFCESKMHHFKKRDFHVICSRDIPCKDRISTREDCCVFNSEFDAKIISMFLE